MSYGGGGGGGVHRDRDVPSKRYRGGGDSMMAQSSYGPPSHMGGMGGAGGMPYGMPPAGMAEVI